MGEDLEALEDRVTEVEDELQELKKRRNGADVPVEVGDIITVVVEDTNEDSDRDPVTHIDGMATFIKHPPGMDIEFGDTLRVKVSDIQSRQIISVATKRR